MAEARDGSKASHFRFLFADIGKTAAWGTPVNESLAKIPYNYCGTETSRADSLQNMFIHSGDKLWHSLIKVLPLVSEEKAFDFYLSDGRYRVACASIAFLHALERGGDMSKVMVGLHDWNYDVQNRQSYLRLEEIADLVIKSEKLAVFRMKHNLEASKLVEMYESHRRVKQ